MTPITEHNRNFIQIGFAPMNPAGFTYEVYPERILPEPRPVDGGDNDGDSGSTRGGEAPVENADSGGSGGAIAAVFIILLLLATGIGGFFFWRKRKM